MIHEHVPNAHSWTLVQITITIRRLVPFQFHGGTSIDRSIYRFHEHLWSIRISGEGRRLQTTRIRRARDGSANEESQRRLDPAFFARKTCVTNFFFIRHTPLPSPPSSALYTPLFLSRSTTRRPRSFLSIFFGIPPSPPPFLEEFVLSRKKKRFFFSRCTFVTSFVCFVFRRPRTRMITIRFLFSWLFIFPSRKTNEMHSSFSPWCTVRLMGRKD